VIRGSEYYPSLRELRASKLDGTSVPVWREILADLDTPVSAYLKIRDGGPSFLLESVEGGEQVARYSFLGANPRRVLRVKDGRRWFNEEQHALCGDPLHAVREIVEAYRPAGPSSTARTSPAGSRFDGGALGYLSYEAARYFERLPTAEHDPLGVPDAVFLDVDTVLIFDHVAHKIRVVSHAWLDRPIEAAYSLAVERIDAVIERLVSPLGSSGHLETKAEAHASNLGRQAFEDMVRRGKEHIAAGDLLQIVLSQRLTVPISGDPFALYRRLRTVSPSPYLYFLDFGDHQLVGASPELLLQVEGDRVTSRPIAGTRRRGRSANEDEALAKELMADEKERAEHLMLVDLARNDVGRVSRPGSVKVTSFMGVERFSHVMHLVSDVTGHLKADCNAFDALRAAFPAGTVSGAPKIRAMQIISELEPDRRGPYAGGVGFFNTSSAMEMAITIRTGLIKDGHLHVQAGAGIVADSVPELEFVESMNKARALLEAAGGEM